MVTENARGIALNRALRGLAAEYAVAAAQILDENLVSVVLFGSVARGEAGPDSDIDLLVVCRSLPRGAFRRREVLEPVYDRLQPSLETLWERGSYVSFSELIRTAEEAQHTHPLYLDMTEEAQLLFDRDGFFATILARVRERLRELGARRQQLGRIRYWDLKPDFKPGEVITL